MRTLLIVTSILCIALAAGVWRRERARKQADLVQRLEAAGATVKYDYDYIIDENGRRLSDSWGRPKSPQPEWALKLFGRDFFHTARYLRTPQRAIKRRSGKNMFEREGGLDPNLLHEALADGHGWWGICIGSQTLLPEDLDLICDHRELDDLSFLGVKLPDRDLKPLANLKQLEKLTFYETSLADCDLSPIGTLHQLQELDFTACDLKKSQLKPIGSCVNLTRLTVGDVTGKGDYGWLNGFEQLAHLGIWNSEFDDSDVASLKHLKRLKHLMIAGSQVTGTDIDESCVPQNLNQLHVMSSPLKSIRWIEGLPVLEYINLDHCRLRPETLGEIEWPPEMKGIALRGIVVDDHGFERFLKLQKLESLALTDKLVDQGTLERFQELRPNCRLEQ
jgi:hypothetical protein